MHANHLTHPTLLRSRVAPWVLGCAGLLLLVIGASILSAPVAYQASMGVDLPGEATLLSDLRAMGGGLLGLGVLLVVGSRSNELTSGAALAGSIVYLSYGMSRVLSMVLDGYPAPTLMASAVVELVMGAVLAWIVHSMRLERSGLDHRSRSTMTRIDHEELPGDEHTLFDQCPRAQTRNIQEASDCPTHPRDSE